MDPNHQMNDYVNLLNTYCYSHCITKPTHAVDYIISCIDHILVNFYKNIKSITYQNSITVYRKTQGKWTFSKLWTKLNYQHYWKKKSGISTVLQNKVESVFQKFMIIIEETIQK